MNIAKEQEQFIRSLNKTLSEHTKQNYQRRLGLLLEWMKDEGVKLKAVRYNDLLNFVRHCKKQNISTERINRIIHVVQQYFTIKQKEKIIKRNPVVGLHVKGTRKKLPKELLDRKTLDKLYENYPTGSIYDKRNKVILGLLVHQGLSTGDLERLRTAHVKLSEGKLYVPASPGNALRKTMSSRTLELKASQVLELKEYLEHVRSNITSKSGDHLFTSDHGSKDIGNVLHVMGRKIRQYEKHYRNAKQIRASVIAEWLKEKDVRVVQYLSGHVRVTSTERYKAVPLEDLQQALEKFHPMK